MIVLADHRVHPVGVLFALGVAAVLACNDGHDEEDKNQFREDVIWCEEAVARLERCCPTFNPEKVVCNYFYAFDTGCGTDTTTRLWPALTKEESQCIRDTSCDAIIAQKVCPRAEAAGAANTSSTTSTNTSTSTSGVTTTPTTAPTPPADEQASETAGEAASEQHSDPVCP